ncbi:unnamed protein product [Amoebophrya sp. A120]|nr:unnamed protein product [Amoebophrya sp. A120]|eukprot:GSA120T00019750001.1
MRLLQGELNSADTRYRDLETAHASEKADMKRRFDEERQELQQKIEGLNSMNELLAEQLRSTGSGNSMHSGVFDEICSSSSPIFHSPPPGPSPTVDTVSEADKEQEADGPVPMGPMRINAAPPPEPMNMQGVPAASPIRNKEPPKNDHQNEEPRRTPTLQ